MRKILIVLLIITISQTMISQAVSNVVVMKAEKAFPSGFVRIEPLKLVEGDLYN